jgi:hypothetical protein
MVSEETLVKACEAFLNVRRDRDLKGWELDDSLGSPFSHESNSGELTLSLLRGDSERISIALDLKGLLSQEGAITVMGLEEEIETALHEKGILA